jgi:enoyl-CoA hydratase/carnithine racemase
MSNAQPATAPRSDYRYLRLRVDAGIAVVTLNRPEHLNAFLIPMILEMSEALRLCDADDRIRVVVITGAGQAFSAGADLKQGALSSSPDPDEQPADLARELITARDVRKPVIAAINGDAIGMGVTLTLHCDFRIVAEDARLAIPMVRRGLIPEMGAHWTLSRIAGAGVAADLLLTGRRFSGAEAVRLGVCGEAVPRDRVLSRAMEIAADIAENVAPRSAAVTKHLLRRAGDVPFQTLLAEESEWFIRLALEPDAAEGVAAFVERRTPRWTGLASAEPVWPTAPQGH